MAGFKQSSRVALTTDSGAIMTETRHDINPLSEFGCEGYQLRFTCQACGEVVNADVNEMLRERPGGLRMQ